MSFLPTLLGGASSFCYHFSVKKYVLWFSTVIRELIQRVGQMVITETILKFATNYDDL